MKKLAFTSNPEPTLGVEIELALVNSESMALESAIHPIVARAPERYQGAIKPELMQCYLEINSAKCRTVAEAEVDLREKIEWVEGVGDELGVRLFWGATHPFSLWEEQDITPNERYQRLLDTLQDTGRQLVTFGLHVHVGVDSGEKAILVCDRIMPYLPLLLAISVNSPFWEGRVTGLQSSRSKIMEGLPTAGLPTVMRNWSEYTWLINHLVETGFINTIREIWWDVRPHNGFGTVEIRVCDMPGNLADTMAIVAFIHCLVKLLSDRIDEGMYQPDSHPMIVRQNKWRACRYGPRANLVESFTHEAVAVREIIERVVRRVWNTAAELQCQEYLKGVVALAAGPSWADRQLALLGETGSPAEVVRVLTEQSRLSPSAPRTPAGTPACGRGTRRR